MKEFDDKNLAIGSISLMVTVLSLGMLWKNLDPSAIISGGIAAVAALANGMKGIMRKRDETI